MNDLENSIWIEKYRPQSFDDLIFDNKDTIQRLLENPAGMPSMIFHSSKPGTGKTSTAKLIVQSLGCDCLVLNSSLDRSIDSIRERVNHFARCVSSVSGIKRCVFFDEADGLTKQAQDSLRNLMEEYSENCFFIFTANDKNKIIEPIQSRCQIFAFEKPSKANIMIRLDEICAKENLDLDGTVFEKLVDKYYPDMRKMIGALQMASIKGMESLNDETKSFEAFLQLLKNKDVTAIGHAVYSGDFDLIGFNNWYFHKLYENYKSTDFERTRQVALRLANVEKYSNLNVNLELIAISEYIEIAKLL